MSTPVILSSTPSVILNGAERKNPKPLTVTYATSWQTSPVCCTWNRRTPRSLALTPDTPRFPTPPYAQYPIRMDSQKRTQPHPPRRRGAPTGNQNARTHGFYSSRLTEKDQDSLPDAVHLKGLQGEIGLLRLKIRRLASYPDSPPDLLVRAINTLARTIEVNEIINNIRCR